MNLRILNLVHLNVQLDLILHLVILVDEILHRLDLLRELGLFLFALRDQGGQLLLNFVPLLVGRVGHFDNVGDVSPFLAQLGFKLGVDVLENDLLFSEVVDFLAHYLVLSYGFVEF